MLVALQLPAAMSGQLANDCLRNAFEEQDRRRHLVQIMNSEVLNPGTLARRLKGFPEVHKCSHLPVSVRFPGQNARKGLG